MNTCEIEIKNNTYKLCLNRNSIKEMERKGFDIQKFAQQPITYMDILWYGGFVKNHSELSLEKTTELIEEYQNEGGDVEEVITFLAEEYASFVSAPADTKLKKAKITRI